MSAASLIFVYVSVLLGALFTLSVVHEWRQRRIQRPPCDDRIFRCERCGYVFTDDADVDRSRCPQCGRVNEPITF